jgi:TrmH family RNA methyltransferase
VPERISSKENSLIKLAARLRDSAKTRREEDSFFCEGARLCADTAGCARLRMFFFTEEAAEKYPEQTALLLQKADKAYTVPRDIAAKLSDAQTPQGVFCIFKKLDNLSLSDKMDAADILVALENIQDPANLGAVIRTAHALGVSALLLSGCCDRYSPKVQRAAMGSLWRAPIYETEDLPAFIQKARGAGVRFYAAVLSEAAIPITHVSFTPPVSVVIGNEGSGVSKASQAACDGCVTIPMARGAQSLNAAAAASIFMWEMTNGRGAGTT